MQVKLKIKTKSTDFDIVRNVFEYHKTQFFIEFSNVVKISLHETTLEDFRLYCIPYELLHRKKLCFCCKNKVVLDKEDEENIEIGHMVHNGNEAMEIDKISQKTA